MQTLRNYRLLCPNGLFFRDGQVCEDCLGNFIPYPGIMHGCYRESMVASTAVATMLTVHRAMNTWIKMVDVYITLTEFARQKMIQGGLPAEKIVVKPNFRWVTSREDCRQAEFCSSRSRFRFRKWWLRPVCRQTFCRKRVRYSTRCLGKTGRKNPTEDYW